MPEDSALPQSNEETTDEDIRTILGSPAEAEEPLVDENIFDSSQPKVPIYKNIPLKAGLAGIAAMFLLLPMIGLFSGNLLKKDSTNSSKASSSVAKAEETEEEKALRETELANSDLKRQLALQNQAFTAADMEEDTAQGESTVSPSSRPPIAAATPGAIRAPARPPAPAARPVASRSVSPPSPISPMRSSPSYRPVPSAAPVTLASRSAAPSPQNQNAQSVIREAEPEADPFERRDQLQALGSYGASPPMTGEPEAQLVSYGQTSNPDNSPYIKAISQQTNSPTATSQSYTNAPEEKPLTEAEIQYELDTSAVLMIDPPEVSEESAEYASPLAIMPGTSAAAELPYGFSWQEGAPLPEVLLLTTEDIMAGDQVAIPVGTQFLGQAQIDPRSGAVTIQIIGMFGEKDIPIPRASVIVRAEDGSVLTASASGRASRGSSSNMGGFLVESLGNSLGNVIGSDDNIATDIAGGVAETIVDNQVARSEANAAARNSRAASQPFIWTVDDRSPVRLTFNNYIPLSDAL